MSIYFNTTTVTQPAVAFLLSHTEPAFVLSSIVWASCTKSMMLIHHMLIEIQKMCLNICEDLFLVGTVEEQDLSQRCRQYTPQPWCSGAEKALFRPLIFLTRTNHARPDVLYMWVINRHVDGGTLGDTERLTVAPVSVTNSQWWMGLSILNRQKTRAPGGPLCVQVLWCVHI